MQSINDRKYLSIEEVLKFYPFTNGQFRFLLHHREVNGLDESVVKIGKRLYIVKESFDKWIESHV